MVSTSIVDRYPDENATRGLRSVRHGGSEDGSFTLRFPEEGAGNGSFVHDRFGLRALPFNRVEERFE